MSNQKLILADCDEERLQALNWTLFQDGYDVCPVTTGEQITAALAQQEVDVLLVDLSVMAGPAGDLRQAMHQAHQWVGSYENLTIVLMVSESWQSLALEAVKYSAYSYLVRPVTPKLLGYCLGQAFEHSRLLRTSRQSSRELEKLRQAVSTTVHDLNNKLTTLFTGFELLRINQPELDGKSLQLYKTMYSNLTEINSLLKDLPLNPSQALPRAPLPAQAAPETGNWLGKILMVDDDPDIAMLADALQTQGYQVDTAENGIRALSELEGRTYELIISDINMPVMDGRLFYQEIAESHPDLKQKMIFITGDNANREVRSFLERTHCVWLQKPFSFSELKRSIQKVMDQQSA